MVWTKSRSHNGVTIAELGGGDRLEGTGALGLFRGLEHDVRLEQLADVRLQLDRRQLQQPDRLLQLRGHGQLLTQLQLQ